MSERTWLPGACLCLLTACLNGGGNFDPSVDKGDNTVSNFSTNVDGVYFGDPLPTPLVVKGLSRNVVDPHVRAQVVRDQATPLPAFYPKSDDPRSRELDIALLPFFDTERRLEAVVGATLT